MLTKGNDAKVQNEVMAQIVADTSAKWMKFTRLLPKQEIEENSQYYTYMSQRVNIEEAIQSEVLVESKDIAPGTTLHELNVRKPISETISIDTIGGVLNVSAQMLDSNLISVNDMLQDVGILIGRSIEKAAIDMITNSSKVAKYDFESGDDTGMTILKAQEKFKESAGSFTNLNSMAVSYKSLTTLKSDLFSSNRQVEPVEHIQSYYGVDNIDILGTAVCEGGSEMGDKTYIGMDYINPGMKLLYSRTTGTTVAPLGQDGEMYDFYPLIEFMRKDIQDKSQIRFISSNYLDNIYLDRNDYEEYLMGLDRITREQLMNGNWYASVKGRLFDESDFHLISHDKYMKIPIVKVIRYWDLVATEVLNDDKLKGSDPDYTAGVMLAKDLNSNIYILDSYEFQLESRNLINEILNTAARDKADIQYIELDGSTGKNFGLLIIDELNRRGFTTGTGNSRENKVDRARRVSADIQKKGIFLVGKDSTGFTKKWAMEFLEKITAYPNEAIHDDCVVAFSG